MAVTIAALSCPLNIGAQQFAPAAQPKKVKDTKGATTASPVQAAQPAEYVVGEGDVLDINVWKEAEISKQMTVRPDGIISLPLVGEVQVVGQTPRQIQQLITDRLKTMLNNPQVTVTVVDVRSKKVYITGEVKKSGAYRIDQPLTVLDLIALAGGFTEFANKKHIDILRAGDNNNRLHFNYNDVVRGKHLEQNVRLQPGDTVVVP